MNEVISIGEIEAEMMRMVIHSSITKKKAKDYQRTVSCFAHQLATVERQQRQKQNNSFSICVIPSIEKCQQINEGLILECLLYIFMKWKSINVQMTIKNSSNFKGIDSNHMVYLTIGSKDELSCSQWFMTNLSQMIGDKRYDLQQKKRFFSQISFRCSGENISSADSRFKSAQSISLNRDTDKFIGCFYRSVNQLFEGKPIYLIKNSVVWSNRDSFNQVDPKQESTKQHCGLLSWVKKIYTRTLILKRIHKDSLKELVVEEHGAEIQMEGQYNTNLELGIFKEFSGSPLQYLQKLVVGFTDFATEMQSFTSVLKVTPNLSILQCSNLQMIVVNRLNNFLELFPVYVPLIKSILFKNIRVQSICVETLKKVYYECAFLIELQLGLRFKYMISDTFSHSSPQERQLKMEQRQILVMLQGMRLRNITLHHNIEMIKLLLKQGFTFISALEIVDFIEPICI